MKDELTSQSVPCLVLLINFGFHCYWKMIVELLPSQVGFDFDGLTLANFACVERRQSFTSPLQVGWSGLTYRWP